MIPVPGVVKNNPSRRFEVAGKDAVVLKVSDIQLTQTDDGRSELSARVNVEKPRPESYRIWFRGPQGCFGDAPLGDVYFAAFWIPAMFLQEEFELDGEVSKELLNAAYEKLEPILLRWFPDTLVAAPVRGMRVVDGPTPPSAGHGCMYSAGLDSSYSVARNFDSLTHLIFVHGFDIPWDQTAAAEKVLENLREGAVALKKELIVLQTNLVEPIRDLTMRSHALGHGRPDFSSGIYFGTMLVTFGLCLRGLLGQLIIPSSWSYEYTVPRGSHPLIEPNWSTPTINVRLDGCEADRVEKATYLVEHRPEMLSQIRVCFEPNEGGRPNCGKCLKCLKTMMEIRMGGASEAAYSNFDVPLDLELARRTSFGGETGLISDALRQARRLGDREVTRTLEIVLGQQFYWRQARARLRRRWDEWKASRRRAKARRHHFP